MQVLYLVFRPESLTFTVSSALCVQGHRVSIWAADPEFGTRERTNIQRRVLDLPSVELVERDPARLPGEVDRLLVQTFPRPDEVLRDLPPLARRARAISLVTAGDRSRRWGDALGLQWQELARLGRAVRKVDRVLYKDGPHARDLFGTFRRREVVGFDVHSQFLTEAGYREAMHAPDWAPDATRPCLVNFMGSRDPQVRLAILDAVRGRFVLPSGEALTSPSCKRMVWHEYSDAEPGGLTPPAFVDTLTQCDFTLCPRGYSLVTHRPIEALLRGSIPVLDEGELDLYGIDLADGRDCIAVGRAGWAAAIDRIAALPEAEAVAMRRRIHALRPALDYARIAAGISARVGV
jgi:hypothetical protein